MTRSLLLAVAASLCACAIQPPKIAGPYAEQFSDQDLHEIALLIAQHPKIEPDIIGMVAFRPNAVWVHTGHQWAAHAPYTYFVAVRRHGKWTIDESSIKGGGWVEGS